MPPHTPAPPHPHPRAAPTPHTPSPKHLHLCLGRWRWRWRCWLLGLGLGQPGSGAWGSCRLSAAGRGPLLSSLGCSLLVGPPPHTFASAIRCHQKSTSNSAGSSVGCWVLSTPPRATPRLGGVYVPCQCQYFPCSFVLALRELGLRLGVKARLPLRAPRQLPWSPPRGPERAVRFYPRLSLVAHSSSSLQIEIERNNALCRRPQSR
jgi:hypothetical protein